MIRVLIAEDQAMVRGALASLLGLEDDIEVVAEVERGDRVLAAALATRPDVALLDIEMPGLDGISAAGRLARELPETRSLILTTFGRPGYLRRALAEGASGFLLKDAPASELAAAIRAVARRSTRASPPRRSPAARRRSPTASATSSPRRRGTTRRPRSPPSSTSRRARCATTSARRSRSSAPATATRRSSARATRGGCDERAVARPRGPAAGGDPGGG
jgi:two-component system, NarL family, response regulator DesR